MHRVARLIAVAAWLIATPASAQPAGAQAEAMFRQAKDLFAAGKIPEACAAFDASEVLEPTVSTLLNQANCREKNNQLATAWGLFLEAERKTRAATDDATIKLHSVAVDRAAKLEPRLSTLTIVVPDGHRVSNLEIAREHDVVDGATWGKPLPIDGGTFTIAAHAPGRREWSAKVTIEPEHDAKTLEVPALALAPIEVHRDTTTREVESWSTGRTFGAIALGGGVAMLATGFTFGVLARSTWNSATAKCGGDLACDPDQRAAADKLVESARLRADVSTGLVIGGALAAGVGIVLCVTSPNTKHRITVSPARDGITLAGRF